MDKILLIGPLTNKKDSTLTGGAIVLFKNLLKQLDNLNISYEIIDTNKKNYSSMLIAYLSIYFQIFIKQFKVSHISLHSSNDYIFFAPYIIILSKFFGKGTSLRKFGGEALDTYNNSGFVKRILLNFIFKRVDFLFLEMKYLVSNFKNINKNTFWFPNVRDKSNIKKEDLNFKKRFVFISHIIKEKGIDEIIEVQKKLNCDYTIDIYGSINDKKYSLKYLKRHNISYKGRLNSEDVLKTLIEYDVLLLPSYKEGYPGIVIESYSVGIPIISTKLPGLKEITDEYKTGILIQPKNIKELESAILYFNKDNYKSFSQNAYNKFDEFDSNTNTKLFLENIGIDNE